MVGRLLASWEGLFLGAMLVSGMVGRPHKIEKFRSEESFFLAGCFHFGPIGPSWQVHMSKLISNLPFSCLFFFLWVGVGVMYN